MLEATARAVFVAVLAASGTAFHLPGAPAVHTGRTVGDPRGVPSFPLRAKYYDASGEPIKAALTSYMHFCVEQRPRVTAALKAELGAAFEPKLVLKRLGSEWRKLDAGSVQHYKALATVDKQRFDRAVGAAGVTKTTKATKQRKESGATKQVRSKSGYMLFCDARRADVAEEVKRRMGKAFKYQEVMRALGAEWRSLGLVEKRRFNDLAADLKARSQAGGA